MIASVLRLNRADCKALKITDAYSLHRVVYDLFEDTRSEAQKKASVSSGILYADKGGDWNCRQLLLLSDRAPGNPKHGQVESRTIGETFLTHDRYRFEVIINPTKRDNASRKLTPIKGRDNIAQWFIAKAPISFGFIVNPKSLEVNDLSVKNFDKQDHNVTQGSATLIGELSVIDREKFKYSFQRGIGRGRAFGFGLLQIVPILSSNPFNL